MVRTSKTCWGCIHEIKCSLNRLQHMWCLTRLLWLTWCWTSLLKVPQHARSQSVQSRPRFKYWPCLKQTTQTPCLHLEYGSVWNVAPSPAGPRPISPPEVISKAVELGGHWTAEQVVEQRITPRSVMHQRHLDDRLLICFPYVSTISTFWNASIDSYGLA